MVSVFFKAWEVAFFQPFCQARWPDGLQYPFYAFGYVPHMRFPHDIPDAPVQPGVYLFYDRAGELLYVGKSKCLRKRVKSYLKKQGLEERKQGMVEKIHSFETIITNSESEALAMEADLIKSHRPPFNVTLKDDRGYCYIYFSDDECPYVKVVYNQSRQGTYYGPYLDYVGAKTAVGLIREIWGIRDCSTYRRGGCVNYNMGLCLAPCKEENVAERYHTAVNEAQRFLKGEWRGVKKRVEKKMEKCSRDERFEEAARLRDALVKLNGFFRRRTVFNTGKGDTDVIALRKGVVSTLIVRDGKVVHSGRFYLESQGDDDELLTNFLLYYYHNVPIPPTIALDRKLALGEGLEEWLKEKRGKAVKMVHPQRGKNRRLLELAIKNVVPMERRISKNDGLKRAESLKNELNLPFFPSRIEGYDVSQMGDEAVAGSMVVFKDGVPSKEDYRWFKVRSNEKDDVGRMRSVLERRAQRMGEVGWDTPDLVLVDGGQGQVNAARTALSETGIPVMGLAKRKEEIFFPGLDEPVVLPGHSPGLKLLMHVRDEAHRFANRYRLRVQADRMSRSKLDAIPGVGSEVKMRLLKRFGSVEKVRYANPEEVSDVKGVGPVLARRIKEKLAGNGNENEYGKENG